MFNNKKYRVGDVLINPEMCLVSRDGLESRLELRVMQVLVCLLERAGRPVSRDELIKEVWRGGVVSDNAINRIIAQLRSALGDDAKNQRLIKTVPKVGYLLTADVEALLLSQSKTVQPRPLHTTNAAPEALQEAMSEAVSGARLETLTPEVSGAGSLGLSEVQPQAVTLERRNISSETMDGATDTQALAGAPDDLADAPDNIERLRFHRVSDEAGLTLKPTPKSVSKPRRRSWPYAALGICLPVLLLWGWDSYHSSDVAGGGALEINEEIAMLKPLTSLDGQEVDPALSPSGRMLAFSYRELNGQRWRVMTQELSTGQINFIRSDNSSLNQRFPTWSDDGAHLAFMQFNGRDSCQVMLLDLLTQNLKTVAHCHPSSQSGALALKGQMLFYVDSEGVEEVKKIYQVDLNTLRRDQLSLSHSLGRGDYGLSLSPDKRRMAVLRNLSWFDTQIMLFDFASGEWQTALKVGYPLKSVAWSADGNSLIYRAEEGQLHRLDLATGSRTRITKVLQEVNSPRSNELGQTVAVAGELIEEALWIANLGAGNLQPSAWVSSSRRDYRGVISHDGKQTAFVSNRTGLPQIWLKHSDGREHKLSDFSRFSFIDELTFSVDGKALAGTINGEAFVFDIATTTLNYIPGRSSVRNLSWGMNNNELILFSSDNGQKQLQLVNVVTGTTIKVLANNGFSGKYDYATGKLYYSKIHAGGIWTVADGQERLITDEVTPFFAGAWSVESGKIWFLKQTNTGMGLVEFDPQSLARQEHAITKTSVSANSLSLSEDGKVLLSVLDDANVDVVLFN
ncbi:winged helix-turn-helix domain-containing protein [Shewanella sp. JM162201]|uniref:Winged helix-turn-helix domain-containing protein n=1 Tax=Shewanella jiangmenensis TaxID=2837387 RepID=A0ABS5V375_9GAMM|nr:winged helix-turn-helix domain-containing protein [Shewanella jiangmenensis]MBT1444266.1 winged helix-turn-helix domain-containing protein [Shewanella jiangmenensis]